MRTQLLLCDVGNTTFKIGVADRERVQTSYCLPMRSGETADSIGLSILALLNHAGVAPGSFIAAVISSVVPRIDPALKAAVGRYLDCPALFVPRDLPVPLENRYERPAEVGADRLVGAYGARRLYPDPKSLIVVDYGTATTFDCVSGEAYLGGLIFPGPATAASALAANAARLPTVNLDIGALEPAPGRNTETSMRHGLVFGFVCVTEGLVGHLRNQLTPPVLVLATGGFSQSIARLSPVFDAVLPALLLEGLRRLYFEEKGV